MKSRSTGSRTRSTTPATSRRAARISAYSLYVLARAGRSVLGDLRYYADTKIDAFATPIARAQIGAGLAMLGDKERSALTFASALSTLATPDPKAPLANRADYGTQLRDAAAVLALMGEAALSTPQLQKAFNIVTKFRAQQKETTTQESLWLLLAARTLDAQNKDLALEVNGAPVKGSFQTVLSGSDLTAGPIQITNVSAILPNAASDKFQTVLTPKQFASEGLVVANRGPDAVPASVLVTGEGLEPEPSAESGFKIERKTYAPDGREIPFDKLKQNDRVVVVLKVTEVEPKLGANRRRRPPPGRLRYREPRALERRGPQGLLMAALNLHACLLRVPGRPLRRCVLADGPRGEKFRRN